MSQTTTVLKMLRKAGNHGVANYKFPSSRILRYSARIAELRQEGFNIPAPERQMHHGRFTGVYVYHLIEEDE